MIYYIVLLYRGDIKIHKYPRKKIKKYQAERASNNLQHIQKLAQTDYY